jgi:hypothetical protein
MKEQKNIKNKISIWECVCPKCGNNGDFELPQGVIPKYCSRCGSEADYREVAGYETGENKKTPQEIYQEELVKLCSPIIEFLKQQSHPYHAVLIKEESVELLETKQYIPQTRIQEVDKKCDINLMIDGKEMSKLLINRCLFI